MKPKYIGFIACLGLAGMAQSAVIYVDSSATGADDGSSWSDAYASLQDALDAVSFGDEVWVASGEFFPSRQADISDPNNTTMTARDATFWIPRGVQMYGGFAGTETDPDQRSLPLSHTVLNGDIGTTNDDSDNSYHVVFYSSQHGGGYGSNDHDQTTIARIDGFRVINGNADSTTGGGGMYIRAVGFSSGVYTTKIDIANCEFEDNATDNNGGGVLASFFDGDILSCDFTNNTASGSGGGCKIESVAVGPMFVQDCQFVGNEAGESGGGLSRAGSPLSVTSATPMYVVNCSFASNSTDVKGGGMFYSDNGRDLCQLNVINSLFYENSATDGGGLYISGVDLDPGVISMYGFIYQTTFADNTASGNGGGVGLAPVGGHGTIYNSILWGNTATTDAQADSGCTITYSCVQSGFTGSGNISTDPHFRDASSDDYTLRNDSPALDAGRNTDIPPDVGDLDGDSTTAEYLPLDLVLLPRQIDAGVTDTGSSGGLGPIVDMGPFERCSADMDRDGDLDSTDVSIFNTLYAAGDPDADINGDGVINFYDQSAFTTSYNSGCGY